MVAIDNMGQNFGRCSLVRIYNSKIIQSMRMQWYMFVTYSNTFGKCRLGNKWLKYCIVHFLLSLRYCRKQITYILYCSFFIVPWYCRKQITYILYCPFFIVPSVFSNVYISAFKKIFYLSIQSVINIWQLLFLNYFVF